jgi:formylglycine-generating enzyme
VRTDGYEGTSPVEKFAPNGYGLYDMAGKVWEWTADDFVQQAHRSCCAPERDVPSERFSRKVIKGGSHRCAPNYRPPARQSESVDTSTSHIGFRCVIRT